MNKLRFFSVVLLLFYGISMAAVESSKLMSNQTLCSGWLFPDTESLNKMNPQLASTLYQPKSVKVYLLKNKENPISDADVEIEPNFVRDILLEKMPAEKVAFLQFTLFSCGENYHSDDLRLKSPYFPIIEFEFTSKNNDIAHVLISLSDMTWSIIFNHTKLFNYDFINERLIVRFCETYLKNL